MAGSANELEKLIVEKNEKLDALSRNQNPDREEVRKANDELDRMLFLYYKSLGSKKNLATLKKIIR